MAHTTKAPARAEIKTRTAPSVKESARNVYARWGITLNDAINLFLIKSIEVGGLPFDVRPEPLPYGKISARAIHPAIGEDGLAILPAEWDDDEG